ncbi:MAG: hypothetical protein PVF96_03440 [Candidatus Bathyarchaeota archaeon]|jgi:putative serine/threonine protein kinase
MLKKPFRILVEDLERLPYANILCYPRSNEKETRRRISELRELGITEIEFCGDKQVFNVPVLGKGCVGIVVCAFVNGERAALKIRRDDTDKDRIYHEGVMLKKANKVNVGPTLLATTKNFLLMRFINGDLFPEWLIRQEEKEPIETVLRDVLEKGWILDSAQIDHGELSYASKHIIVDHENQPFLVDFETASINRRSKNVTSICQYFFMSGKVAEIISGKTGVRDKRSIVEMLKRYKRTKTRQDFKAVLSACCL